MAFVGGYLSSCCELDWVVLIFSPFKWVYNTWYMSSPKWACILNGGATTVVALVG
jgi:hypothetical protein